MAQSTGLILAAGGIALANGALFNDPSASATPWVPNLNWRIVPATVILALVLGAMEQAAPKFAVGLAGLTLLASLVIPMEHGNKSFLDNLASIVTVTA